MKKIFKLLTIVPVVAVALVVGKFATDGNNPYSDITPDVFVPQ